MFSGLMQAIKQRLKVYSRYLLILTILFLIVSLARSISRTVQAQKKIGEKQEDITKLGVGLQDITKKTETNKFWGATGSLSTANPTGKNGKVDFHGKMRIEEFDFEVKQNLFSGLFVQAHVPLRRVKIDRIEHKNLGEPTLAGQNVDTFIKDDLPKVLEENGFIDTWNESFKRTRVPEFLISGGWEGFNEDAFDVIESVKGSAQVGVIIPTGTKTC